MKLFGYALDKTGTNIAGAIVEIKDEHFQTLYSTESDADGYYEIEAAAARYPFVIAVKDYAAKNLEYWCQNIDLRQDMRLDVRFEMLEVYGLHVFCVKGGQNALMVYFRPMSLARFAREEEDIAPQIKNMKVTLDGQNAEILVVNQVEEYAGDRNMTAYLLHVAKPDNHSDWCRLDVEIWDYENHYGTATIFRD